MIYIKVSWSNLKCLPHRLTKIWDSVKSTLVTTVLPNPDELGIVVNWKFWAILFIGPDIYSMFSKEEYLMSFWGLSEPNRLLHQLLAVTQSSQHDVLGTKPQVRSTLKGVPTLDNPKRAKQQLWQFFTKQNPGIGWNATEEEASLPSLTKLNRLFRWTYIILLASE